MPRVMFMFQRSHPNAAPTQYRVVDRSDARTTGSFLTNAMVEQFDGYDYMEQARWVDAGPEGVQALLNELIYFTVTQTLPGETVAA